MHIDNIKATNFKNFADLDVSFKSGVNLFVGSNGSGKTSILDAVNVAIGGFFGSLPQREQRYIKYEEIRIKNIDGPEVTLAEIASITASSESIDEPWTRTIKESSKNNDSKFIDPARSYGEIFFKAFSEPENRTIAPVFAYYSTQRLFKDASNSKKQSFEPKNGRKNGYIQCLGEFAIKPLLEEWLAKAVIRRATMEIKDIEQDDLVLLNVEKVIEQTLTAFLEEDDTVPIKVYPEPYFNNELFVQYKHKKLPLRYYSDGFRNLLFLVFDLVWRASQLNPFLSLEELSEKVSGVVTIDEIDLHLHPKWQEKAIPLLQNLFPKVQFFITTHSPIVVANFQNGTLYTIEDNSVRERQEEYFGKEVNNVLRNILGAHDRHIGTQQKLDKLFELIDNESRENAIQDAFAELVGLLGNVDAEIQRAK